MRSTVLRLLPALTALVLAAFAGAAAAQTGSLTATPNPCSNLPGTTYCTPLLSWTSSGLGAETSFVQVRLGDQIIRCEPSNAAGSHQLVNIKVGKLGKTFTLWATSDCTTYPFTKVRLDEVFARNDDPQGRIWVTPNPCVVEAGKTGCQPLVRWDSLNLASGSVRVTVDGAFFACGDANIADEKPIATFAIDALGKTFALHQTPGCRQAGGTVGPPLATVTATSVPTGTPVCSLDDQPLTAGADFFGIIENHKGFAGSGPLDQIAGPLSTAGVHYLRRTVRWSIAQPSPPGPGGAGFDWTFYDNFLGTFVAAGLEPWITLSHTPSWAVTHTACDPDNHLPNPCRSYPPTDIDDWRTFVREAVLRYGRGTAYDVRNWEIWQEPDIAGNFLAPPADYADLVVAAIEEIEALEPTLGDMRLWAPNTVIFDQPGREQSFRAFTDAVLATDAFDGFSLHTFHEDHERNVYAIDYARALLAATGHGSKPLAVTATSFGLVTDDWEGMSGPEQATYMRDAYVCQANRGATQVMWFAATDTPVTCNPQGPPSDERGALETVCDAMGVSVGFAPDAHLFPVIEEIGAFVDP